MSSAATLGGMDAANLYGYSSAWIAERIGVSEVTARRWKRAKKLPAVIARLARLILRGELGEISRPWRGWALRDGKLVSAEGWEFEPGEILAIPFFRAQLAAYQAEQRLPRQSDFIEGRYKHDTNTAHDRAGDRRRRSG